MNNPLKVTRNHNANEQLLYFTGTSLSADDKRLYFISDATGSPNVFCMFLDSGEIRQLTRNRVGFLKSYVYFDGDEYSGLGKASVCLDAPRDLAYYIEGDRLCRVGLDGAPEVLAELPRGQMTAFMHVSADGKRVCVPTTDARALEGFDQSKHPAESIDLRVHDEKLNSFLRVFDTATGREILREKVPLCWITHVQFSPANPDLILYNHEWPAFHCGIRRMWLWDGATHSALRSEGGGRSHRDWTCHELWESDGSHIIYHGAYKDGPSYIGRVNIETREAVEIPFPPEYKSYGHFTADRSGALVSDGYYCDAASREKSLFISTQTADWQRGTLQWHPLCEHRSSWKNQDSHPHPIYNHRGDKIYFTSDCDGKCAVHEIASR
jgi:Periplasmic component of the Tol biopolymer transport system